MKKITTIILLVIGFYSLSAQNFILPDPDADSLNQKIKNDNYENEVVYYYLFENFEPLTKKINTGYYDWDKETLCRFTQIFDTEIEYTVWKCKEAGGITVSVTFPKLKKSILMNWIEKIYEVDKDASADNIWKKGNTKFEPRNNTPGCYYKINEYKNSSVVEIYCSC